MTDATAPCLLEAGTGAGGEDRDDLPARDDHGCTRTIARGVSVPARARAGDGRAIRAWIPKRSGHNSPVRPRVSFRDGQAFVKLKIT